MDNSSSGFSSQSFSWQNHLILYFFFLGARIPQSFVGGFAVNWRMFPTEPLTALNAGRMLEWKVVWLFVVFFLCFAFFLLLLQMSHSLGNNKLAVVHNILQSWHHKVIELHNLLDEKQHNDKVHSFSTERS